MRQSAYCPLQDRWPGVPANPANRILGAGRWRWVCQNPGMNEETFSRRTLFGRVLLVAGGAATLLTLTGCPGGGDGDDDDEEDEEDD